MIPRRDSALARLDRLNHALNTRRLAYAWIMAATVWISWFVSLATGSGLLDRFGQVIGTDYLEFYAAGRALASGDSARLYDTSFMGRLELQVIGPALRRYYGFLTPPFLAWLYEPFSSMPYLWSFALWTVFGLALLWISLRLLAGPRHARAFMWSLTCLPVFAAVSYGQNSFLSLSVLSFTWVLWQRGRLWEAGAVASLMAFKPQLLAGVGLLWLLRWKKDWTALLGLIVGISALVAASVVWLPEASRAYARLVSQVLPGLPRLFEFPLWNLHTARGFWWLLLPGHDRVADVCWALTVVVAVLAFARFASRFSREPALLLSGAVTLTLLVTPHAMIYDWALLLIPAVLLWRTVPDLRPRWRAIFAVVWVATYVSGPLTLLQQRYLPFAVQLSVPTLAWAARMIWLSLEVRDAQPAGQQGIRPDPHPYRG